MARNQERALTEYRGTHDWTLRTINLLSADYTVVRLTMLATNISGETPAAWLDDIEFTSQPPSPHSLAIISVAGPEQLLIVPVQAGRQTAVETSTNLTEWLVWTNLLAPTTYYPHFPLPTGSNNIPQFFRARIAL